MSRRSFIELTIGSLMSLPALAGGLIVAPTTALAAGDTIYERGSETENYVIIDVVNPWEVGLIVRDVTRTRSTGEGTAENVGVPNAHVTVTSRANGKTVSGVTNEDGVVNLDIKELAEDPDGVGTDNLSAWNFNGSVSVTCDGYWPFETALMRVEGGGGLIVPIYPAASTSRTSRSAPRATTCTGRRRATRATTACGLPRARRT